MGSRPLQPALTPQSRRPSSVRLAGARLAVPSCSAISAFADPSGHQESLAVLKNAVEVRVSPADAQPGHPVHLRRVVTYYDAEWGHLFVQDSQAGIFVSPLQADLPIQTGDPVEVEGLSAAGDFAPIIAGRANHDATPGRVCTPPLRLPFDHLASGREDSNWVEPSEVSCALGFSGSGPSGSRDRLRRKPISGTNSRLHGQATLKNWSALQCGSGRSVRDGFQSKSARWPVSNCSSPDLREIKVGGTRSGDPSGLPARPIGTLFPVFPANTFRPPGESRWCRDFPTSGRVVDRSGRT